MGQTYFQAIWAMMDRSRFAQSTASVGTSPAIWAKSTAKASGISRPAQVLSESRRRDDFIAVLEEPFARLYPATDQGPARRGGRDRDAGRRRIVLFTTLDLSVRDANDLLQKEGFRGVLGLDDVKKLDKLPILGSGKTDYKVAGDDWMSRTGCPSIFLRRIPKLIGGVRLLHGSKQNHENTKERNPEIAEAPAIFFGPSSFDLSFFRVFVIVFDFSPCNEAQASIIYFYPFSNRKCGTVYCCPPFGRTLHDSDE